jgi:hypothetical protein
MKPEEAIVVLTDWAWNLFNVIQIENQTISRLNAIASVDALDQSISASPTQAQVQNIQQKLNEIITAAQIVEG